MRLGGTDLEVVVADITALKVDAITNAANAALELHWSALQDPSAGDERSLWSIDAYAFKSN
jgi:hypothetical protein